MTKTARRFAVAALALATVASSVAPHAAQAGNRDFSLENSLPWTATSVFIRPAGGAWSRDLLGTEVLRSGQRVTLRLGEGAQCLFDVKVGFADSTAAAQTEFSSIDLCRLTSMNVYFDGQVRARNTVLR